MFYPKYQRADWVKQYGLPQHHLRIVDVQFCYATYRWKYQVFDTTLSRRFADFFWMDAAELELNSELVMNADNFQHANEIIARCGQLRGLWYSIPARTDCESIQGFIQAGQEKDRFSPQVQGALGTVAILILLGWWFGDGSASA
jgi:hypothetical protein